MRPLLSLSLDYADSSGANPVDVHSVSPPTGLLPMPGQSSSPACLQEHHFPCYRLCKLSILPPTSEDLSEVQSRRDGHRERLRLLKMQCSLDDDDDGDERNGKKRREPATKSVLVSSWVKATGSVIGRKFVPEEETNRSSRQRPSTLIASDDRHVRHSQSISILFIVPSVLWLFFSSFPSYQPEKQSSRLPRAKHVPSFLRQFQLARPLVKPT